MHGTKPQARAAMVRAAPMVGGARKYLWKLERPRGPLEHPEVLVCDGRAVVLVAPAATDRAGNPVGPSREVLEWASQFQGWAPAYG